MADVDRTPVEATRGAFAKARDERLRAQAELARRNAAAAALARTVAPSDPALAAAAQAAAAQAQAVAGAWRAEAAARAGVTAALGTWLLDDPALDVARLEARYPIVFL